MARRGISGDHGATTGNGRLAVSTNGHHGANGKRAPVAAGGGRAPRVARRQARRRIAALVAALPDGGGGPACLGRLVGAIADPDRRGRRLEARLADCLVAVETRTAGRERWLTTEAVAWGVAVATRRRASRRAVDCPLVATLEEVLGPARDALASGDLAAARCLIVAGTLLTDVDTLRRHADDARAALEAEIARFTGPDGALVAGPTPAGASRVARVADWAATRAAVEACGQSAWNRATEARFQEACVTALALLGPRCRCPGDAGPTDQARETLVATIAAQGRRARATIRRLERGARGGSAVPRSRFVSRELTRADGCQAVIRSGWDAAALRVFVDWQEDAPWLEVAVGGRLIVSGPWPLAATVGGTAAVADGPWRFTSCAPCRHGTFLEIARSLVGGGELQRQIVVLAADRVALLADAVVVPGCAEEVTAESRLAVAAPLAAHGSDETRERLLGDPKTRAALLPLALPEWSSAPGPGELAVGGGGDGAERTVRLCHSGARGRLLAPLWIDGDGRRAAGPLTWRQLTVADTRRILGRHEAVGYRVQAGHEQWLVYRALDEPRNRTLLGCNVSCELLVGRIKPRGRVGRSIEIE